MGSIAYIYSADGVKLTKTVTKAGQAMNTHYRDGFQYIEDDLDFFPHAACLRRVRYDREEDTLEVTQNPNLVNDSYNYIFHYLDHLGNIRVRYAKDTSDDTVKILEEKHYYPFGLQHKGYNQQRSGFRSKALNNTIVLTPIDPFVGSTYTYGFQGQETQDELGLGWQSFKYRNYSPDLGRFWSVDPLAEDYVYNSPYAFAENRVIDGIELEGLEWKSVKDEETGNTHVSLTIQLTNDAGLNERQLNNVKESISEQFTESFSGEGFTSELIIEDAIDSEGDFSVTLIEQISNTTYDDEGNETGKTYAGGQTPADPNTQENSFTVTAKIDGSKRSNSSISRSFSHEAGHTGGLLHPWDPSNNVSDIQQGTEGVSNRTVRRNLMNSDENIVSSNRGTSGKKLTSGQLKSIDKLIREQQ